MLENLRYDDESMSMYLANQKQEEVADKSLQKLSKHNNWPS